MAVPEQEDDHVVLAPREGELAGFAEAAVLAVRLGDLAQGRILPWTPVIAAVGPVVAGHGLDETGLALRRLDEARAFFDEGDLVQDPDRYPGDEEGPDRHDEDQHEDSIAFNHLDF